MGVWPVIVSEEMYHDDPVRLAVGDRVRWDVQLIDGEAGAWPTELLAHTTVEIEERSPEGAFARTPELVAFWNGASPIGARFAIHAALAADWFNPHGSIVSGTIERMYNVWVAARMVPLTSGRPFYRPAAPVTYRRLVETRELDRLPTGVADVEMIDSLLVELDVHANDVAGGTPA
jgi:hypothetical protein